MSLFCSPFSGNINKFLCGMKRGGLVGELYVANLGEVEEISSTTNDKNMDTITMKINPVTTDPYFWFRIAFKRDMAGLSNEVQFGNNIYANQTITFAVEGITAQSLEVLEQMVDGEAVFIAKDYNGVWHVLGRLNGLTMSAMTYGTGTAADDMYGGEITFSSEEAELSSLITPGTQIEVDDNAGGVETITLD